jgi:PIN domain nuclease of toxin-antitoxin system
VTAAHGSLAGLLDWANRDPFDRIIAAQAMSDGRRLVTKDAAFATLPGIQTLW